MIEKKIRKKMKKVCFLIRVGEVLVFVEKIFLEVKRNLYKIPLMRV